jgi:type VI secretion system protein ImpA
VIEGIDLETILAPISVETPAGTDMRNDFSPTSVYFRLRDARADARAAERAADANPETDGGLADGWRQVRSLAVKALSEQAKDLEIAAWLTESLVRSEGLPGLTLGAEIIAGLAERYWDDLFPMPDEDGISTRVAPVTGLNGEGGDGTLIQPLRKQKLFNGPDGYPVMLFQYEQSAELPTIADETRLQSRLDAGVVPFDTMEQAARAASGTIARLGAELEAALAAWNAMGETLDRLAGYDAPPTSRVRETLGQIGDVVARYAPAPGAAAVADAEEAGGTEAGGVVEAAGDGQSGGGGPRKLKTREDALKVLSELADYFRKNEPQSPLAYTIDDAVRRARLTWPELIEEIIEDGQTRAAILTSLGIRPGG